MYAFPQIATTFCTCRVESWFPLVGLLATRFFDQNSLDRGLVFLVVEKRRPQVCGLKMCCHSVTTTKCAPQLKRTRHRKRCFIVLVQRPELGV